jgi:hypothetical protein
MNLTQQRKGDISRLAHPGVDGQLGVVEDVDFDQVLRADLVVAAVGERDRRCHDQGAAEYPTECNPYPPFKSHGDPLVHLGRAVLGKFTYIENRGARALGLQVVLNGPRVALLRQVGGNQGLGVLESQRPVLESDD